MQVCDDDHYEIVYTVDNCPMCTLMEESSEEIASLTDRADGLETDMAIVQGELDDLKGGVT